MVRGGFAVMYGGNYDGNVLQTGSQGFGGAGNIGGGQVPLLRDGMPATFLSDSRCLGTEPQLRNARDEIRAGPCGLRGHQPSDAIRVRLEI